MQKEHPILFSTPMVQALLAGTKTMTRRVVKPTPENVNQNVPIPIDEFNKKLKAYIDKGLVTVINGTGGFVFPKCPYGQVGDLLWVRESFYAYGKWIKNGLTKTGKQKWVFRDFTLKKGKSYLPAKQYLYEDSKPEIVLNRKNITGLESEIGYYKRPSIHMPKAAARNWLEITNIRVERLQDITERDAISEGIKSAVVPGHNVFTKSWTQYYDYIQNRFHQFAKNYPIQSFRSLWYSINGEESWNANPWVWVIEFKKVIK